MENASLKLNGPKSLLADAWRLYKTNFAGLMKVSLIPVVAVALITGLTVVLTPINPLPAEAAAPVVAISLPIMLLLLVGLVIIICVSIWGQLAVLSAVVKLDNGPINIKESFRQGWQLLASYIWIAFLSFIILLPAFALLIIPGIWLAVALSFTAYILIVENQRGFAVIKASYAYVKGYWWPVAGRLLLVIVIVMIPTIIVTMPFEKNSMPASIANAIISLLVAPYTVLYMYGLYKNLRAIKGNATAQAQ